MTKINVKGTEITIINVENEDFISITDMLKAKDGDFFISDWLRNRNTVEFLGIWEKIYNPNFNYGEYAIIRSKDQRLIKLNQIAISQMMLLTENNTIKKLSNMGKR